MHKISFIVRVITVFCCIIPVILISCQGDTELQIQGGLRDINGTQLYIKVIGEGEPIVVIHGGPGMDHTYFLPQMKELAKTHRLIFFDQRVSGRSSMHVDSSGITLQHFIDDIEGIREAFGLEKMNLMGHSWGGLLAMFYAIEYPENLKSLILSNSTPASAQLRSMSRPRSTPEDSLELVNVLSSETFKNRDSSAFEKLYRIIYRGSFYDRELTDSLTLTFQPGFAETSQKLGYLNQYIAGYDIHDELAKIICPTLVIHSEYDSIPEEASRRIYENIPNSTFKVLKNCGHFPFVEKPDEFFDTIRNFLKT